MKRLPAEPYARPPAISSNGLHIVQQALDLAYATHLIDPVLVAIDFEGTGTIRSGYANGSKSQAGLAVFDTRSLRDKSVQQDIETHNIVTGPPHYALKAFSKTMFGRFRFVEPAMMLTTILSVIPQDRCIILIGHDVKNEVEMLMALGFESWTSLTHIVDTASIANETPLAHVTQHAKMSLTMLVTALKCPYRNMHIGSNDANFTLKAAILMAIRQYDGHRSIELSELEQDLTQPLPRDIKKSHPPWAPSSSKSLKKLLGKFAAKVARASSRWTSEEQSVAREERAARRASLKNAKGSRKVEGVLNDIGSDWRLHRHT